MMPPPERHLVSEENRMGLYIAIPVYFVLLLGCAFWARRKMEQMSHDHVHDKFSAHYLGGRQFGPIMTAGTLFASLFSGYTVIGIPNEAFRTGWLSLRWMPSFAYCAAGLVGCGLRLRKASVVRNHQSPCDFITDRFQSQLLRYTIVFLQVVPSIIYLSAQVNALKSTFNALFGLDPDVSYPVVIIMFLILMFEWAGGLSSVALTDCIQGFVMLLSFIMLPAIIKKNFGGWTELDVETYPRPEFFATPTKESQWYFWQFALINVSFFTLPHFMQRNYAAINLKSLRAGWFVVTIGPWVTMFVGAFLGTVGVQMLAGQPTPASPFTAIIEQVMNLGGFAKGVGIIAFTAGLAAIMSTADSLIIATSQLLTAEICYPLRPQTTPKEIAWFGRIVSLLTTAVALCIGILWKSGITALGAIQFPLSMQCVPAFVVGLFCKGRADFHPWCLSFGAIASTIYVFAIYFGYEAKADDPRAINAGITGLGIHLVVALSCELVHRRFYRTNKAPVADCAEDEKTNHDQDMLFPDRPEWDKPHLSRFGEKLLTPDLLDKMMAGLNEPFKNLWYAAFLFFAISLTTPLTAESEPDFVNGAFLTPPATMRGIPWWAMKISLLCIIPYSMVFITILRTPGAFPVDEKKIEKDGIDPDVVELTPKEMGRRVSYDGRNDLVYRRRSTIRTKMHELGLSVQMAQAHDDAPPDEGHRRLSALILGKLPSNIAEVAAEEEEEEEGAKEEGPSQNEE